MAFIKRPSKRGPVARLLTSLLLVSILATSACKTVLPPPPEELDLWSEAAAGVTNPDLARLSTQVWESDLQQEPFHATYLGDPRYHGEIPLGNTEAVLARVQELRGYQSRLARLDQNLFSPDDALTAELLAFHLETTLAEFESGRAEWNVDPLAGPHIQILNLTQVQPTGTARERAQLVRRWGRFPAYLSQAESGLLTGRVRGLVSSRTAVEKVVRQVEEILETPPMASPLVEVATGGGLWVELAPGGSVAALAHEHLGDARQQDELRQVNLHLGDPARVARGTLVLIPAKGDPLSLDERGRFLNDVLLAVEDGIYPALRSFRDVLATRILPASRSDAQPGLVHVRGGAAMYGDLIREHTSLPRDECDPQAIHDYGLAEVARIRGEIAVLGERLFGITDVAQIQERLRTDPEMHFASREEVQLKAGDALARAQAKMRQYFGIVPATGCVVTAIAPHEEKDTTIAYYQPPSADGSRPGQYFINTYQPETRPRYEAEVLAYHEAIPGHHLQIALAQEMESLPLFRRHSETTAFVEGWALYTERLSDEMGLYSGDLDRLGMLSFDAWRASRLVVDTGIHAFGWSRDEAIEYMYANTLLARNNVANEVDRYIAWPGQALAYKIGQREILALRDEARANLGNRFAYRTFHDRVLENGAVTLASLRGIVGRWLGTE